MVEDTAATAMPGSQAPTTPNGRLVAAPPTCLPVEFLMPVETRTPTPDEVNDPRQMLLLNKREPAVGSIEYFEKVAATIVAKNAGKTALSENVEPPQQQKSELGKVIRLPVKPPDDPILRLEQNLGCELPVCVSNRRDVKKEAIEVTVDGKATWRLVRAASTSLPAPEHLPFWLWFQDRCQAAAKAGHEKPPRIALNPAELRDWVGGNMSGEWYKNVDEAFWRFSHLIVESSTGFNERTQKPVGSAVLGTLCHYASWRRDADPAELEDAPMGWVAPGPMLWASIRAGYLKALPLQTMRRLPSYVAQRLLAYLSKHCRPGGTFKISLTKLLPKIPLSCPSKEAKRQLKSHHQALVDAGFLACTPVFEGRGNALMVTYERPSATS